MHAHISSFALYCKLCNKEFKTEVEEKFHLYEMFCQCMYKCSCDKQAWRKNDVNRHETIHQQANIYAAEIDHAYALHVPMEL